MLIQISYLGITEAATLESMQLPPFFLPLHATRDKEINYHIYSFME